MTMCGQGLHDLWYTTTNDYPLLIQIMKMSLTEALLAFC